MIGEKPKKQSPSLYLKYALKDIQNQTLALTKKNFLIFSRNLYVSIPLLICPLVICLYLNQIQSVIDDFAQKFEIPQPPEFSVSTIHRCPEPNCVSLGIGLTSGSTPWTDYVIGHISKSSNLELGKDIQVLTESDPLAFLEHIKTHKNQTQTGVIFCSNFMELPEGFPLGSVNCNETLGLAYLILYNFTIVSKNIFDQNLPDVVERNVVALKLAVDNAIINYQARKKGLPELLIEVVIQAFPLTKNRFLKSYDVVSVMGHMYFFIPPMFIFGVLVAEIVKEKEMKLRNGLSVIGVSASAFWLSWFIVALVFSFLSTNCLLLSGYFYDFEVFTRTPYSLLLFLFMLYTMTMMVLGFMLSTLISSVKFSYTISYTFLLGGIVIQTFFQSSTLMKLFHIIELPDWVPWVRLAFSCYPPFNFSKVYGDIAFRAGTTHNPADMIWEKGPGYTWDNFFEERAGSFRGYDFVIPSSFETMKDLAANFAAFAVITWYLDHVVSGNRGRESERLFMFTRDYWGCKRRYNGGVGGGVNGLSGERGKVGKENRENVEGMVLEGLWKTYPKSKTPAVHPLQLTIENDELVAIIGHNGAGKTTLLNMLTGLLAPSGGTAYISSYDLSHDIDNIHKVIGYCPQFNILWEELTAREHLNLFATLRNTPVELRTSLITQKLEEVNLGAAADKLVGTYSGGMKRRLSVAISSIGNPSIIFMDEPTTGMDPITRREVWKLIQKLKKNRVIILNGEIKCNGTCLYLKNHYGDGYKVEMVSENPRELWEDLEKKIKSLKLVDISGGSLYVSIPRTEIDDVQKFFRIVEESKIQDWGLRNSSLEEVFMKVTGLLQNL